MHINALDHVVLTVRSIDATCEFYSRVLGMQVIEFGQGRKALQCGAQKLNLHQAGKEFEPKAAFPTPGAIDLCLLTTVPLQEVMQHLRQCQVDIVEGPVRKNGATSPLLSVYIRDPDNNLIEIANTLSQAEGER
ncbi:MAG TPA: VOC family protein [Ktedonobacteraceae bacterium]|jgi:catechol 2,3-dioxygenase-like lactoylglutathione lyase family enzyme